MHSKGSGHVSKGISKEDYTRQIALQLGAGLVTVEIEEQIPDIVELAFLELKNYITDMRTMTLPYSSKIDLSGKKVFNVIYIMRAHHDKVMPGYQDVIYARTARVKYELIDYARRMLAKQNMNAISTDLDFHYDKEEQQLYVYAHYPLPSYITIVYTPDYEDVSEITEPFWQNILRRLALALTKETLGRVRGKYQLITATYNLDADRLLSEAQAELAEIREYLNSNTDLLLPID